MECFVVDEECKAVADADVFPMMVGVVDPPEGSVEEDSLVDEASAIKDVAREVNNNHNKILILMLAEDLK